MSQAHQTSGAARRRRGALLLSPLVVFALSGMLAACAATTRPEGDVTPDSGTTLDCERGTEFCLCLETGRCLDQLICVSERCLSTRQTEDPDDPTSRGTITPVLRERDAGTAPGVRPDAGGSNGSPGEGAGDAGVGTALDAGDGGP